MLRPMFPLARHRAVECFPTTTTFIQRVRKNEPEVVFNFEDSTGNMPPLIVNFHENKQRSTIKGASTWSTDDPHQSKTAKHNPLEQQYNSWRCNTTLDVAPHNKQASHTQQLWCLHWPLIWLTATLMIRTRSRSSRLICLNQTKQTVGTVPRAPLKT